MSQVPKEDHHQTLEALRRRAEQEKLEEQELREAEMASWEEAEVRQAQEIIIIIIIRLGRRRRSAWRRRRGGWTRRSLSGSGRRRSCKRPCRRARGRELGKFKSR